MAVTMSGERVLPADKATVWARLNDAETLKAAIPGCESLEKLSDTELQAVAKVKIGPVSARFKGKVNLTDMDPPNSYRISGQGEGGIAGFAKGGANVRLTDAEGAAPSSATTSTPRSAARSPSSAAASSTAPPRSLPTNSSPTSPRP
jgi:carbon monoxide dehydrogenase subunit G